MAVSLAGNILGSVFATYRSGLTNMMALSLDGKIMDRTQQPSGTWSDWEIYGDTQMHGNPSAISRGTQNIDVFSLAGSNECYQTYWRGDQWVQAGLGGNFASDFSVVSRTSSTLDVFARGYQNKFYWYPYYQGQGVGAFNELAGAYVGTPAAASWSSTRLDVFGVGFDNKVYQLSRDTSINNNWVGPTQLDSTLVQDSVTAASNGAGTLSLVARDTNNFVNLKLFRNNAWTSWQRVGTERSNTQPAAIAWGTNSITVAYTKEDNSLWLSRYDGLTQIGNELNTGLVTRDRVAFNPGSGQQGSVYVRVQNASVVAYSFTL